ncbi:MAG: DUF1156 domain-containing protein [Actinobacteria bacterium]|nr:DUF1156 domain-containing protein [Actinomycetota bacterium]
MAFRKKLIEVALPLEAINRESAREKSIRHGHPSTLHLWWARRPLAACRAVLFASLVDDPSAWPELFPTEEAQEQERKRLFAVIEELVKWENSNDEKVLLAAQTEIARSLARARGDEMPEGAEAIRKYIEEHAPPVLDPFCGGGSIPLEAQRLGLQAYASDLNPVAVLITKALIEIPPKFAGNPPVNPEAREKKGLMEKEWRGAEGLAEDVRYYGRWMRDEAERRIGHLYPKVKVTKGMAKDRPDLKPYVGQELTVIAWLWARTVPSPNPACKGAHVPLVRSFWFSAKKGKEAYVEPVVDRQANLYRFEVRMGKPKSGFDPGKGTVGRKGGRCLLTDEPIPFTHIRKEGQSGRMGARLMAIVAEGGRGRVYLSPIEEHIEIAKQAMPEWRPEYELPENSRDFKTPNYGMRTFASLFTDRQLVALTTFSDLVTEAREKALADAKTAGTLPDDDRPLDSGGSGPTAYADAVATYLAFGINRTANRSTTICIWNNNGEKVEQTFGRQAIPMTWDYAEANILGNATGSFSSSLEWIPQILQSICINSKGRVKQLDAIQSVDGVSGPMISTDPPYYDNIGYADLSDFFYIWLRRSLSSIFPKLFSMLLTPKATELIASPYRHGGNKYEAKNFFEKGLKMAFEKIHDAHNDNFPLVIYYGFKQTETEKRENELSASLATASTAWETMLEAAKHAGFIITGTWPMRTERDQGLKTGSNVLASSIVLACRPRPDDAPMATRREFIAALKSELPEALRKLQHGNIAPVDLAQAAIGPGMAVFTRYSKVMEADGSPMTVRTALSLINQTLDEVLAEQEGEFDADTRWAVAWFEQHGMEEGPFGDAETLSKAKNTSVRGLVEAGILEARGGRVRLLRRDELIADWDPASDRRFTIWEATQHLIRALQERGESGAAELLRKLGGVGESARDLSYRLYSICERKGWAPEALAYNSLVISWPEITRLALSGPGREETQQAMLEME